jgi:hypothetical protein
MENSTQQHKDAMELRSVGQIIRTTVPVLCGLFSVASFAAGASSDNTLSDCQGTYLGEEPPGTEAKLFAPGVISTFMAEDAGLLFTPDGSELFVRKANFPMGIIYSRKCTDGVWGEPETAPFSGRYWEGRLALAPDGQRLYFSSPMPLSGDGAPKDNDFWYVRKTSTGWSEPVHLGSPLNSAHEENDLSVAANGTIYFNREGTDVEFDIYRSRLQDGRYQEPQLLRIPGHDRYMEVAPMVAPDESYIVFTSSGRPDQTGSFDLYVSFQSQEGLWTEPKNLGDGVNSTFSDKFSTLSPDGKYMFFVSRRPVEKDWSETRRTYDEMLTKYASPGNGSTDIYWVSTEVVERHR